MRDIFFPFAGTTCDSGDVDSFDFKVQVGAQCWENVHPDHLQVYGKWQMLTFFNPDFSSFSLAYLLSYSFQLLG